MKINNYKYYAIINCIDTDAYHKWCTVSWFNNRVYLGRYVMSAYNQIKNKEEYKIFEIGRIREVKK